MEFHENPLFRADGWTNTRRLIVVFSTAFRRHLKTLMVVKNVNGTLKVKNVTKNTLCRKVRGEMHIVTRLGGKSEQIVNSGETKGFESHLIRMLQ
jgi:hypothetical protein